MIKLIGLVVTIITTALQVIALPEYLWNAYPFLVWFPLLFISLVYLFSLGASDDVIDLFD